MGESLKLLLQTFHREFFHLLFKRLAAALACATCVSKASWAKVESVHPMEENC